MSEQQQKNGQKAIVIGASMGGLLAARVLADSYEQVLIIERDILPIENESRKGVPQGQHLHALLAAGGNAIENLFPGITQDLVAQGAEICDPGEDNLLFYEGGYYASAHSGLQLILVSRPCLETTIRRYLVTRLNVHIIENSAVQEVVSNADHSRVTGVRLRSRLAGSEERALETDLVVDATGRGSQLPAWLEAIGYARPEEEQIYIDVCYTSRKYRGKEALFSGKKGLTIGSEISNKKMGAIYVQEDGSWLVTLGGVLGEEAPLDEEGFLQFAAELPSRDLYDAIREMEPLSLPVAYKVPSNRRRYYENLPHFPAGLLVIGDAVCSFNPIYGQGMTVVALEAIALEACLAQEETNIPLAQRFFHMIAKIVDVAWNMAVSSDLCFPEVQGPRNEQMQYVNWYINKLQHAARHDPAIVVAFLQVANMMAPPAILMSPEIVWHVFGQASEGIDRKIE